MRCRHSWLRVALVAAVLEYSIFLGLISPFVEAKSWGSRRKLDARYTPMNTGNITGSSLPVTGKKRGIYGIMGSTIT